MHELLIGRFPRSEYPAVSTTTPATQSWFSRNRARLAEVGTGHVLYATFNWFFDNVLYVYVIYRLGVLTGGIAMTFLSFVLCTVMLLAYDRMRIDWVGVGSLARLSEIPNPSLWQRIIMWAMRRGTAAIFFVLSILQDPFITTAYFRQGRFDGIKLRDWQIFFTSLLISNFYWTLRSGVVAAVIVGAWQWIS